VPQVIRQEIPGRRYGVLPGMDPSPADDELVLMRSPVHPAIIRWTLRPEPSGRRRLALAYACCAAGGAVAITVLAITSRAAGRCTDQGFGCLSIFFRGVGTAVLLGLITLLACVAISKLGLLFLLAVIGFGVALSLVGVRLIQLGAPVLPTLLVLLVGVPGLASAYSGIANRTAASTG
jgi:hypothetical protein